MKRTKYYAFIAAAALCAGAVSCVKESGGDGPAAGEPVETGYYLSSRADAVTGNPEHGDTYTILSYRKEGSSNTYADTHYLRTNLDAMRQFGYYAYDDNSSTKGLVPVEVDRFTYKPASGTAPLVRNQAQGQRLLGVPATGTNSANIGFYRVAMIHPAIPVNDSELGFMAVFNRNDEIYASHPDDKNGDNIQIDPFEIEVRTNRYLHPVDGVEMHPVKAAIRIYLYSSFYDVMTSSYEEIEFAVEEIKLINAGSNGWFNPRVNKVYPNYNYLGYPSSNGNYKSNYRSSVAMDEDVEGQNADILFEETSDMQIQTLDGELVEAQYKVGDVNVFPTDYRGGESGGDPRIIPMTLSLKLTEVETGNGNTAAVPIALEIERNKCYIFYVNVKSKQIEVSYSVSDWENGGGEYAGIGGDVHEYLELEVDWSSGGWEDVPGGDMPIGN